MSDPVALDWLYARYYELQATQAHVRWLYAYPGGESSPEARETLAMLDRTRCMLEQWIRTRHDTLKLEAEPMGGLPRVPGLFAP